MMCRETSAEMWVCPCGRREGKKKKMDRKDSLNAFCPNLKFLARPVGSAQAKCTHWRNLGWGREILVLQCTSN